MNPIDFPYPVAPDTVYDAPNGVSYIYDGVKWTLKQGAEDNVNYWTRNAVSEDLAPKSFNDSINFSKLAIEKLNSLPSA